jgi:glycosyltransferase involved in cell wall biosynthesis
MVIRLQSPHVDVYVLSYKRPNYLRQMLNSLREQDYPNFTINIIDNVSTDETRTVIREFKELCPTLIYRCFPDAGHDRANIPFLWSQSDYVFLPHDDDLVASDWLSRAVGRLETDPDLAAVFSRFYVIDDEGTVLSESTFGYPPGRVNRGEFLKHFIKTGELPLQASAVFRMASVQKHYFRFENPKVSGVALDVQLLRDINAKCDMYSDEYGGYYYRTHGGQTAITMGPQAACSAAYVVSAFYHDDVEALTHNLREIANMTLCNVSPPVTGGYRFLMRFTRWACGKSIRIRPRLLYLLITVFRSRLGELVLYPDRLI